VPSDATEKNRNIGAQLQSILYTLLKKDFGKFTYCMTFGAHKLVHSEPFLDYIYDIWQLAYEVRVYILGPKLLPWNFLQISQLSIQSGAHKLFRWFLDFSQFLTAISRKLWCDLATQMRTRLCSASERMIYSEKITGNWYQNRRINCHTILVWTMPPTRRQTKRDIQKKHQFSHSRRA